MIRTQIRLTEKQARALRPMASERRVSMAELIREAVDHLLEGQGEAEKLRRALAVIGRFRECPPAVSTNHDKYLAEDHA